MERLLVTGVDGPLGINLALQLADRFDVLGLYHEQVVESPHLATAAWPGGGGAQLAELVHDWQPRWIIHCGPLAASAWDGPADNALFADEPRVARELAKMADEVGARLCAISSDVVFAGPRMFHEECAAATNPTPWAAQVRGVEQALSGSRALVVRTHAYGWSPSESRTCFAERALACLTAGAAVVADGRRHATPILATDLAELLVRAYELRLDGLYHLAGAERASPFRFVTELAKTFDTDFPRVRLDGGSTSEDDWRGETSLNSLRARRALQMTTPMLREGLARLAEQRAGGWCARYRVLGRAGAAQRVAA